VRRNYGSPFSGVKRKWGVDFTKLFGGSGDIAPGVRGCVTSGGGGKSQWGEAGQADKAFQREESKRKRVLDDPIKGIGGGFRRELKGPHSS